MNYYEWIKGLNIDEMAAVLTTAELRTYSDIREKLAPNIPEITNNDFLKLHTANLEMLKGEVEE